MASKSFFARSGSNAASAVLVMSTLLFFGADDAGATDRGGERAFGCEAPGFVPPAPGVSFSVRAWDGFIDPRRESSNGFSLNQGITQLRLEFTTEMENVDGSPLGPGAFSIDDTAGNPPVILQFQSLEGGRVAVVQLSRPITLKEWTTLHVDARSTCDQTALHDGIRVGFLPTDVNQDGVVTPFDLLTYKQYRNGLATPPFGTVLDHCDLDRSLSLNPLDLLSFKRLINGVTPATQSWAGETLPEFPPSAASPDARIARSGPDDFVVQPKSAGCEAPGFVPPAANVPFSSRARDGYIDPRRESSNGQTQNLGLNQFRIEFTTEMENVDGLPLGVEAFSISDTAGTPPDITQVQSLQSGLVAVVQLSRPITVKEWTTLGVNARSQCDRTEFNDAIRVGFLPADINQSGRVTPFDLLLYKQYYNGIGAPTVGSILDFCDVDRNLSINPLDSLSLKRLINGISPAMQVWAGQELPTMPEGPSPAP